MGMRPTRVAVIGAGAAGLASAFEADREGLQPVVFEASDRLGGTWVYRPRPEEDPLGRNPSRRVHSSMYESLRTNLPREVMAFLDEPFSDLHEDERQFPGHERVLQYLEDFAREHRLHRFIRFGSPVEEVAPTAGGAWRVKTASSAEAFAAVLICNGHYSEPHLPVLPGQDRFPGNLLHSHNYRRPEPFAGQRVVVLGSGASGMDLALEIRDRARHVFWSANSFRDSSSFFAGVEKCPAVVGLGPDGSVRLADGRSVTAIDSVVFCTGYQYAFPFLQPGLVEIEEHRVHPLYRELIPPTHPTLAFIGLPLKIVPFPLCQMQARWFLRGLAGRFPFPDTMTMNAACEAHLQALRAKGRRPHDWHLLGDDQFRYMNELARDCGSPPLPAWFEPMVRRAEAEREKHPTTYRDRPISPSEADR